MRIFVESQNLCTSAPPAQLRCFDGDELPRLVRVVVDFEYGVESELLKVGVTSK